MAVHQGERFLAESVESILAQTVPDFELIVVDDGSTDRSTAIVRSFADPRIRLVENGVNLGLARSLNRALHLARGEFIARQDADDVSEPRRFEQQLRYLRRLPGVALLGTQCTVIDAEGNRLGRLPLPLGWLDLRWSLLFATPFVHSAVMWREGVVRHLGGYDESLEFGEDYDLWWRIARRYPAANLSDTLVHYRVHDRSMSRTLAAAAGRFRRLRTEHLVRLLGWNPSDEERNETRREAMTALALGWETELELATLQRAVDDLLRLQRAFSAEARLADAEARRHRQRLRASLARNLVAVAAARRVEAPAEARNLLRIARTLYWRALLRPASLLRGLAIAAASLAPRRWPTRYPAGDGSHG